jgi:hypothetical protein
MLARAGSLSSFATRNIFELVLIFERKSLRRSRARGWPANDSRPRAAAKLLARLSRFLRRFSSSFSGADTFICGDLFWLLTSACEIPATARSKPITSSSASILIQRGLSQPPSDTGHRLQPQQRCQEAYFLEDYEGKLLIRRSLRAPAKCEGTRTGKIFTLSPGSSSFIPSDR